MEKKGYDLSIRDYLFILKKRKRIIILVCLLTLTAVIFGTYVSTPSPQYKATASVRVERITDVTGLLMEVISYPLGDVLQGQMELIKSFDVMAKVSKALGLVPRDATDEEVSTNEKYRNAISSLRSAVTVERQGQSNIISINATASSAEKAQQLANLVAEQYREVNIISRNKRVFEAKDFVEKRLQQVEEKHYIGLFDRLASLYSLPSEDDVEGRGSRLEFMHVDVGQLEIAFELLEQSIFMLVDIYTLRDIKPVIHLSLVDVQALAKDG